MKSKIIHLCLILSVSIFLLLSTAEAKNADLSKWLRNLSESALTSEPGHDDYSTEILVSGNTVHVLWASAKADGSRQFYYRRSLDKGATWQPKILITEASGNNLITNENYRRMAVDGNNVHIFIARY
ncbi:MAG: hypothetical protein N2511_04860, partial [Thermodesulfovibrionales bacterium]|nr:hypothetical protein [Thermodesulfovibrionales bacterium]